MTALQFFREEVKMAIDRAYLDDKRVEEREKAAFYLRRQALVEELKTGLMALVEKIDQAEEEAPLSTTLAEAQRKIMDAVIGL